MTSTLIVLGLMLIWIPVIWAGQAINEWWTTPWRVTARWVWRVEHDLLHLMRDSAVPASVESLPAPELTGPEPGAGPQPRSVSAPPDPAPTGPNVAVTGPPMAATERGAAA